MRICANAKINIGLAVRDKRPDGYHDLETFFHKIGLCDLIDIDFYPSDVLSVSISGNESYVGSGMDLMEKALRVFSQSAGIVFSATIHIEKHIPFQAGLGGGSSDAAAVLRAANSHFGEPVPKDRLIMLSLLIGSDVPFFVSGFDAARACGRGEVLREEPALDGALDIFLPEDKVSTGRAFGALDAMSRKETVIASHLCPKLSYADYPNDFELVFPRTDLIREISSMYSYFSLSGSGSAYFGIGRKQNVSGKTTKGIENTEELYCGHEKIKKIENFLFKSH